MDYGALCLIPPVIAIVLSFLTKQVIPSLFISLWVAATLVSGFNPGAGLVKAMNAIIAVLTSSTRNNIMAFAVIGIFTTLMGKVGGFTILAETIGKIGVTSKKAVQALTTFIGTAIFMASSVSVLTTGAVVRPMSEKYKLSSEKLSFLLDATAAPVCSLTLIGPWGALLMGLLAAQGITEDAATAFGAIKYNFYAIFMYILVWFTVITGKEFGPMKLAEERADKTGKIIRDGVANLGGSEEFEAPAKGTNLLTILAPLGTLIAGVFYFLWLTGKGNILKGSGGLSFVYACTVAILVSIAILYVQRCINLATISDCITNGVSKMATVIVIIVLAVGLSAIVKDMHTGQYLAQFTTGFLSPKFLPAIIFVLSCIMSFATGTSYGTMGIMIPIAIPLASTLGINFELVTGAVLAGAVFGDHCSPISDTTIIASMAAGANHLDHVTTQMYYAVAAGIAAVIGYVVLGLVA